MRRRVYWLWAGVIVLVCALFYGVIWHGEHLQEAIPLMILVGLIGGHATLHIFHVRH